MPATSAKYPTAASGTGWSNPTNIYSDNNTDAFIAVSGTNISNYLIGTAFGFTSSDIPVDATIDGVYAEFEAYSTGLAPLIQYVYLTKNGSSSSGSNKGLIGSLTGSRATYTFGGSSDGWGASLTQSDVTASTFGLMVAIKGGGSAGTGYFDWFRLTIYYTPLGGKYRMFAVF